MRKKEDYYNIGFNEKVWEDNKFIIGIILGMIISGMAIKLFSLLI